MSDNRRRYRAIKDALKGLHPTEPKGNAARHLHTLAAMISGIVSGKSVNLPHIASKVPDSLPDTFIQTPPVPASETLWGWVCARSENVRVDAGQVGTSSSHNDLCDE